MNRAELKPCFKGSTAQRCFMQETWRWERAPKDDAPGSWEPGTEVRKTARGAGVGEGGRSHGTLEHKSRGQGRSSIRMTRNTGSLTSPKREEGAGGRQTMSHWAQLQSTCRKGAPMSTPSEHLSQHPFFLWPHVASYSNKNMLAEKEQMN